MIPGFFIILRCLMSKGLRTILISVSAGAFVFLIILLLTWITPDPPISVMDTARNKLSVAGVKKADTYSRKLYHEARVMYDSAMANWQRENRRFIFLRNYEKVVMYAEQSSKKSDQAGENSLNNAANLRNSVIQKIDTLDLVVQEINRYFYDYPLPSEIRTRISKGKQLLEESRMAYGKGEYHKAGRSITDAEYLLLSSYDNAISNLNNYFTLYPTWQRWVNATIKESAKNGDYSIIIDKFSKKCFVYQGGSKKFEFEAELGSNWVGNKKVKGDNATPEGMYKITKKFEGSRTKYYKALLLNYPNEEDKKRFREAISDGSLPPDAKIGGLIEIHGNGGKGIHWTEGCIALTDKEIDVLYRKVRVGTPVTIVGSTVDLQSAMKK
jgi:hypothetical protein